MAEETFEVVHGQLVFGTQNQANNAENAIRNFLARPAFKDAAEQTIFQVPPGKYGAGPTVVVTVRFTDRQDADDCWNAADNRWGQTQAGSLMYQATVVQDPQAGTSQTTLIHRRHNPALPDDF